MDNQKAILMSIKPNYAQSILNGEKTAELRKVKPKLKKGDLVIIYETSPVMAITGFFSVKKILWYSIDILWDKVSNCCAISKADYLNYFNDNEYGCAIIIDKVWAVEKKITLNNICTSEKKIKPPQSYMFLPDLNFQIILKNKIENSV